MSKIFRSLLLGGVLLPIGGLLPGCSVVMEATRPTPVRLAEFKPGESRDSIVEKLGQPVTTTTDGDGASCDLYSLYLSGYGAWAKAGIAFGEFAADFVTLGIAEAASTPTEAITRNKKAPVWFCYKTGTLARVTPRKLVGEDVASAKGITVAPSPPATAATPAATQPATGSSPTTGVAPATTPAPTAPTSSTN